jgi:hypothetical protein
VQGPAPEQLLLFVAFGMHLPLGHWVSAVQKQSECDASQPRVVLWYPEFAGHEYDVVPAGTGMPGLASSQAKPSWVPVPVQLLPHDWSFSPVILTQWPLPAPASFLHCVSFTQTQAPPPPQALVVLPLQLPKGQAL